MPPRYWQHVRRRVTKRYVYHWWRCTANGWTRLVRRDRRRHTVYTYRYRTTIEQFSRHAQRAYHDPRPGLTRARKARGL